MELENIVKQVLKENPKEVEEYKNGKESLLVFFIGQSMRLAKGRANPREIKNILEDLL